MKSVLLDVPQYEGITPHADVVMAPGLPAMATAWAATRTRVACCKHLGHACVQPDTA